jgi:hypothetical protein
METRLQPGFRFLAGIHFSKFIHPVATGVGKDVLLTKFRNIACANRVR